MKPRPANWEAMAPATWRRDVRKSEKHNRSGHKIPNQRWLQTKPKATPLNVSWGPPVASTPKHMHTVLLRPTWKAAPHSIAHCATTCRIVCRPPLVEAMKIGSSAWNIQGTRFGASRSKAWAAEASRTGCCARMAAEGNAPPHLMLPRKAETKASDGVP